MSDADIGTCFAADSYVIEFLGNSQKWWCPLCETQLELGSEVVTFVSYADGKVLWPVVVHSECRTGFNARRTLNPAWETLEGAKKGSAVTRMEKARGYWLDTMGQMGQTKP